jgi:hypothetical protein
MGRPGTRWFSHVMGVSNKEVRKSLKDTRKERKKLEAFHPSTQIL